MKKALFLVGAFIIAASLTANAQLPGGAFGLTASYAGEGTDVSLLYVLSPAMDLHFGLGFSSTSIDNPDPTPDPDATTTMSVHASLRYFLKHGDVAPYIGGALSYASPEKDHSAIGLQAVFGGQAMLLKNFGVYAHSGLGVSMSTVKITGGDRKTTWLGLFTGAVGAAFYF
ncbi:MAG: hypothetical protein QHI48_04790 [Bacteroidota bacterium]|nr:hypothetical protein [Bacteroidota bacterium]